MYDRFLLPYYLFWPIALLSFIFVFFLPINSEIEIYYNKNNKISNYNKNDLNGLLFSNYTEECKNFFNDIENNNQKEFELIKAFNLTIKIVIIVLFGLACLNIFFVIFALYADMCYDSDNGGHCQNWEYTFSCNAPDDNDFNYSCFFIMTIFLFICVGIIILSFLSINYSSEFKNKMVLLCNLKFRIDYDIHFWEYSSLFLGFIIGLYFI